MRRHVLAVVLAVVAASGLLVAPTPAVRETRAATPDLTFVGDARYTVQPAQHRVRVTVPLTLTNHLADTKTTRYYFDRAYLAVMPSASGWKLSWAGSGTPSVRSTTRTKDYTVLRLDLAKRLYGGQSATYTLRFDLVDSGGKATRDIRVGDALVSFPVWAFASDETPGSSATVVFPPRYKVEVAAGRLPAPTTDATGRTIFRSGRLAKPLEFYAFLIGDRPGAYKASTVTPTVSGTPVKLTIRSWPEDKAWRTRIGGLVAKALPVMGKQVGLPWPKVGPSVIQEAVSRSTGGYAGLFDPTQGLVEIAYYANDFVVLHEAAHSWFNGSLLADRWANEAFASHYALAAAKSLKVKAKGDVMTKSLEKSRIPLNAWGAIGRESSATEDYAYAASLTLASAVAARAGDDRLRAVWSDAADHVGAYQPTGGGTTPEQVDGPPDWRGLLDLLDAETGASFDDLWRTWVARPEDLPLLDARLAARTRYDAVVHQAGDWQLPRAVRDEMRSWRFDEATATLGAASAVLDQRAKVEAAAADAGLTPPATLRAAFEDDGDFTDAASEATAELQTISRYLDAVASRPAGSDPAGVLGMIGEAPETDLAAARAAFASGDLTAAATAADQAKAIWSSAEALGQGRLVSLVLLAVAIALTLLLVVLAFRGRKRRRRHLMQAHLIKD